MGLCRVGKNFYIECLCLMFLEWAKKVYTNHGSNPLANKASRILRRSYYDNITSETKRNRDYFLWWSLVDKGSANIIYTQTGKFKIQIKSQKAKNVTILFYFSS